jgi:hypothetical protein
VALPACRAWRILAKPAAEFSATAPAVVAGLVPQGPAGALDGAYPVWVQTTDEDGAPLALLMVDGDGWNLAPQGPGWSIAYGPAGGAGADVLCYVAETVQDTAECGQVNGNGGGQSWPLVREYVNPTAGQNFGTTPWILDLVRPPGANALALWHRTDSGAGFTALSVRLWPLPLDGTPPPRANSLDTLLSTALDSPNTVGGSRELCPFVIGASAAAANGFTSAPKAQSCLWPALGLELEVFTGNLGTGGRLKWRVVWDRVGV